ncbi:MAG: type II secretion system protein GspC [Thermodesulfobacteriota bacterium]|nr:type II secretion system protein GspC [Thermodesulfobacteriota bacterium]
MKISQTVIGLVAVQIDLQKLLIYLLLILSIGGGIIAGMLAGRVVDLSLGSEMTWHADPAPGRVAVQSLQNEDFQIILDRNLFDSKAVGSGEQVSIASLTTVPEPSPVSIKTAGNFVLLGTVAAGENSLALIKVGAKTGVFQLNEELLPGVVVSVIGRKLVVLTEHGNRRELLLKRHKGSKTQLARQRHAASVSTRAGIVAVDDSHWKISKAVVDNARANFNSLLQSARMIPQVNNGKTIGFKLVELEKGSLLEKIGLQVSDLIVEINQVKLNSPEKALQVLQQVREGNHITLGLMRNGQPKTFEYSFE